jgi:TolA-binding protein
MMDPPDSLQATLREYVEAEKTCPDPSPEVGQRVFSRLAVSLGLPPGLGETVPTSSGPSMSPVRTGLSRLAGLSGRGVATFLVGAAVGAATYGAVEYLRRKPAPPAPIAVVAAPVAPEAPSLPLPDTAAMEAPVVAEAPAATSVRGREPTPSTGDSRDRGLAAERKLVEMARTALGRGQIDGALAALRQHVRSFPKGQLAEERDSLLVQALVAKGDFSQARVQATRFARRYPHSLFSPVVEQAVRSIP